MKSQLSNLLAVGGAICLVCGIAMIRVPAGIIALGVLLILGAVATMRNDAAQTKADKKATQ